MGRFRTLPRGTSHVQDGWSNSLKGLGVAAASSGTSYTAGAGLLSSSQTFLDLTDNDWLARRIVCLLPEDAMRLRPDGVDDAVWQTYDALECDRHLARGLLQGRAAGGAVLLLGYERGNPATPAPPAQSGTGLAWLEACPWDWLQIEERETDANSPRYRMPVVVRVGGDHPRRGLQIHMSRTIQCAGLERSQPRMSDVTPWLSVLQPVYEDLAKYGLTWEAVSLLLQEASTGVLKMRGLIQLLAQKDQTVVQSRMRLMQEGRSAAHTVFLDADGSEEYTRTEVSFTAVPQMLEQWTTRMAAAAGMPVTRLFGRAPGGLQSTGDADLRQWYDTVEVYRSRQVAPAQRRLLSICAGTDLEALDYPDLYQLSAVDAAAVRVSLATADRTWYDLDVLDPPEIRASRRQDGSLGVTVAQIRTAGTRILPDESATPPPAPAEA